MSEFAVNDEKVKLQLAKEREESAKMEFSAGKGSGSAALETGSARKGERHSLPISLPLSGLMKS